MGQITNKDQLVKDKKISFQTTLAITRPTRLTNVENMFSIFNKLFQKIKFFLISMYVNKNEEM